MRLRVGDMVHVAATKRCYAAIVTIVWPAEQARVNLAVFGPAGVKGNWPTSDQMTLSRVHALSDCPYAK